jgi:hypothetical protein
MSSPGSIFGDVIEWFLGRVGDRRQYKRRVGAFHVWYQPDPTDPGLRKAGVGLEISPNGIVFIMEDAIEARNFNLIARLRDQNLTLRVRRIRSDDIQQQGSVWHRYMCEFVGIAADDWDAIVHYVNNEIDPDRRKMQHQTLGENVDDAYRLLPLMLQQKLVAMLVAQEKLEPPKPGQEPLLRLFYGGLVVRTGQIPAHRVNVHSRIKRDDGMIAYDTRFLIAEDGAITVLS